MSDVQTMQGVGEVDVYPVGALADLRRAWRFLTARRFPAAVGAPTWRWRVGRARTSLGHIRRSVTRHVRAQSWRALRNEFNGYLAEPREFPPGDYRRLCGVGWTRNAALRSLRRRLPAGPDYLAAKQALKSATEME